MQEYNIGSSTLYDIKARKEQLLEFATDSETYKSIESRRNLHKPKMEQLDKVLYEWFTMRRSEGISIAGPLLIEKAKYFYAEINLTDKFNFPEGWLTCFKMRHGIRRLYVSGGKMSADKEGAEKILRNIFIFLYLRLAAELK
jgi:hypothetical protein